VYAAEVKYVRDGKEYGVTAGSFRNRWWNYYERGTSFAEGDFWNESIADFRTAISQRPSDSWNARTYGMHFVDYFPHREMGISWYQIGRYDKAVTELECSLSQADSARARYYLDKARQAIIFSIPILAHRNPPDIDVAFPSDGYVTNSTVLPLRGCVSDGTFFIRSVSINGIPVHFDRATTKVELNQIIPLTTGVNRIRVSAENLAYGKSECSRQVICDLQGPSITVGYPVNGEIVREPEVTVTGTVSDDTRVETLLLNGQAVPLQTIPRQKQYSFSRQCSLRKGKNLVVLEAIDTAGNHTRGTVRISLLTETAGTKNSPVLLASLSAKPYYAAATSVAIPEIPIFTVNLGDFQDAGVIYRELFYLSGSVSGRNVIKSVSLNGVPVRISPGHNVYFSQSITLQEGENKITVRVEDVRGNAEEKTLQIARRIQKIRQIGSRMTVAVLPLERKRTSPAGSDLLTDLLIDSFVNCGRFNLVSREHLEEILREQKLSREKISDPSTRLRLGKILAADALLVGSVQETPKFTEVVLHLINTETSSILFSKDAYEESKRLDDIRFMMDGLAQRFIQAFPLAEGAVTEVRGNRVCLDLGQLHGMKKEMSLIIFREPSTAGSLTETLDPDIVGRASVTNVAQNNCVAEVTEKDKAADVKVQDRVITR